jgi:hypothetical protein
VVFKTKPPDRPRLILKMGSDIPRFKKPQVTIHDAERAQNRLTFWHYNG